MAAPHYVIDVVVPVYNAPDDVRACVDSARTSLRPDRPAAGDHPGPVVLHGHHQADVAPGMPLRYVPSAKT